MPSARASKAVGGGGILRRKDGTILEVQFTDKNPLWKGDKPAPKKGEKVSTFHSLFAVLTIQEDGREGVSTQPLFVGDADAYEIVADGRGIKGEKPLSKNSDFIVFLETLSTPTDGGTGFDENQFPEDPEGLVADYSALRGQRVMFDWRKNEAKTKKFGQREVKGKDGKPAMKFDREDLVVAAYYGSVDVSKLATVAAPKPSTSGKPAGSKAGTSKAVDAALVAATAEDQVQTILAAAKDRTLTRNKLSVKLLNSMAALDGDLREAVRVYCLEGANLSNIENVTFNAGTDMVSLAAAE